MDTKPTYEELESEVAILRKQCADKDLRIAEQDVEIAELKSQVAELKAQVAKLTKMLFGKKSEKSKKKDDDVLTQVLAVTEFTTKKHRRHGGGGRRPFSSEIPRRDVHVTLAPDECYCPHCGKALEPMGVEISETLNFIPMILEAIRFVRTRMKRTCGCPGSKILIAEPPIRTIDKGTVTTEFVAAMLVGKYRDHLPTHRQAKRLFNSASHYVA